MPLVTTKNGSQLRHSTTKNRFGDLVGRAIPVLSADYIVGLVDGEGCFYVNVSDSKRYKAGARIELCFHIKLKARDRELLERVKETLGCGAVYFQRELRQNHTQCYRYTVAAHHDIVNTIIPFFMKHPLQSPSKRKSFELFVQIVELVEQKQHLSEQGIHKIRQLKIQINQRTTGLA